MSECVYCRIPSTNVIEVRYARTHAPAEGSSGSSKEVVGRGYWVCDGCLCLLDFRYEHHVDTQRISMFNLASSIYQLLAVWAVVALFDLASLSGSPQDSLLLSPRFQALGFLLAVGASLVWGLRAQVHLRYFLRWKENRSQPIRPGNSLAGFTTLRSRVHPELSAYLPVRFSESTQVLSRPGATPLRCIGPSGEPWGEGPERNFPGRGANGWYRLIWISWQLWPLSEVMEPSQGEWRPPKEPAISRLEAGGAGLFAATAFAVFVLGTTLHPLAALGAALASWPVGFFAGRQARELWQAWKVAQSIRPVS